MSDEQVFVSKVVLSTGKIVLVREPKIKDQDLAMRSAAAKAPGDSQIVVAALMQKEFMRMLIVEIDGKRPSAAQLEDLDGLFTYREYLEVNNVVAKVMGTGEPLGNPLIELVKHGG